jgi:FkbH-like protein
MRRRGLGVGVGKAAQIKQFMGSTIFTKLRRRFLREQGMPVAARLRQDALAAARFVTHAALATTALSACNKVGAWVRTPGGKPLIDNRGYIELGSHVVLSSMFSQVQLITTSKGNITIGEGSNINFGCVISSSQRVTLGTNVSIGPYSRIVDDPRELLDLAPQASSGEAQSAPISIGNDVWLAGRVTVLPGARIGAGSVITAGSIVTGEIPPGMIAGGIPARVLRPVNGAEVARFAEAPIVAENTQGTENATTRHLRAISDLPLPAAAEGLAHTALLVSDFTIEELAQKLMDAAEQPQLTVEVAPFQQVVPTLMNLMNTAEQPADLVVVWTLPDSSIPSFKRLLAYETVEEQVLFEEVDAFADLLIRSLARVKCAVVPTWTLPSFQRGLGVVDLRPGGIGRALMEMNKRLADRLHAGSRNIHVLNAQRWLDQAGRLGTPPKLWYMGKVAYGEEVFREAACDIKAALTATLGGARKLVVVDLDDTMWGGIVGDAGWQGLRLGGHDSIGEAFVDFQRALRNLKRRGIVLAIASKNEESVALEAIRSHSEMVLREEDFAAYRINWNDKAQNVVEIARELNLGLQSVVFIDDNPVERARVREALPEVFVPEWPEDKHLYASTLLSLRCFDSLTISGEDLARTTMLQAERERTSLMSSSLGSVDEWVKSLHMTLTVDALSASNLARTTQLLNKTNQMNLSTRRLSENELREWASAPGRELWTLRVADRFGDSGLTGIVSIEADGKQGRVVDYILSCRVMGRKVEEALLHVAVRAAQKRGLEQLHAKLLPTAKNKPCKTFWLRSGFDQVTDNHFVWDLSKDYPVPAQLELKIETYGVAV